MWPRLTSRCPLLFLLVAPLTLQITLHSFTGTSGVALGKQTDGSARVPGERCAHLMACAIYYRLSEVWISLQPILLFTYLAQYTPATFYALGKRLGPKRVADFRKGTKLFQLFGVCAACIR